MATPDLSQYADRLREVLNDIEKLAQPPAPDENAPPPTLHAEGGQDAIVVHSRRRQIMETRAKALLLPPAELKAAIADQAEFGSAQGAGIPISEWTSEARQKLAQDDFTSKFLDAAGGAALIRQDLEPLIYASFVRRFPVFARLDKVPANGLVHTFQRVDARPTPAYIAETATVPDSTGVYTRATTNIAVLAVRVGTSMKEQLAVRAGGMGWNAEQMEINFGVESLAARCQQTLLQGNASAPAGGADNDGPFDANAHDGLRRTVPAANIRELGTDTILEALGRTDNLIVNNGGRASVVLIHASDNVVLANQLQPFRRFVDSERVEVVPGLPRVIATYMPGSGEVPLVPVPGADWAAYTANAISVRDSFVLDESVVAVPYLGSDSPTVIELPFGVTGALTKLYLLVYMNGLAVRVPNFIAKLRVPTTL